MSGEMAPPGAPVHILETILHTGHFSRWTVSTPQSPLLSHHQVGGGASCTCTLQNPSM